MGEVADRATSVVARTAGNTVSPAVAGLMTLAGAVTHHPELAIAAVPIAAFAGAVTEEGMQLAGKLWRDRAGRVQQFADTAADEAGISMEDLIDDAMGDPAKLELLARATEAAARSLDHWKIDMLARAYAQGVTDDAAIDSALIVVETLRQIEATHLRLLTLLTEPGPLTIQVVNSPVTAMNARRGFARGHDTMKVWDMLSIGRRLPTVDRGFSAYMAKLESLGLIYAVWDRGKGQQCWVSTALGQATIEYLRERAQVLNEDLHGKPRDDRPMPTDGTDNENAAKPSAAVRVGHSDVATSDLSDTGVGLSVGEPNTFEPEEARSAAGNPTE